MLFKVSKNWLKACGKDTTHTIFPVKSVAGNHILNCSYVVLDMGNNEEWIVADYRGKFL